MKVIVFGQLTEFTGASVIEIEEVATVSVLKKRLEEAFTGLLEMSYIVAVNREVVHGDALLDQNSEIAILPPFSGG